MSHLDSFVADFDYSAFHPGSGFFNLVNASIQDNYNRSARAASPASSIEFPYHRRSSSGELTCTGSDFNSTIACVGFNNGA
jgi:hypothetical protein